MPEVATDPPASSCNRLYPRPRFQQSQLLGPDLHLPRARDARGCSAHGKLRQPARAPRETPLPPTDLPET